jgi:hypothetical protein
MKAESPIVGIFKAKDKIYSSDIQIGLIANTK